jgi:hypothetical protein
VTDDEPAPVATWLPALAGPVGVRVLAEGFRWGSNGPAWAITRAPIDSPLHPRVDVS